MEYILEISFIFIFSSLDIYCYHTAEPSRRKRWFYLLPLGGIAARVIAGQAK